MLNNNSNPLPNLLKHYRIKEGLTQEKVAEALHISRSGYANYEEGRCLPNIDQVINLSNLLHHDLLFAYRVSTRNLSNKKRIRPRTPLIVEENSKYGPVISIPDMAMDMLQKMEYLSPEDLALLDTFVDHLATRNTAHTLKGSKNED